MNLLVSDFLHICPYTGQIWENWDMMADYHEWISAVTMCFVPRQTKNDNLNPLFSSLHFSEADFFLVLFLIYLTG